MKPVFLTNIENKKQFLYWQIKEISISCLKLVSSNKEILQLLEIENRFFLVGKLEKAEFLIADVHLIESILRREPLGMAFQKLNFVAKEN